MIDIELKNQTDKSVVLLDLARSAYDTSDFVESERCTREVLSMLEPHLERDDIGNEADKSSQKYDIFNCLAHTYNRLNNIDMARSDYAQALRHAEIAIGYSERIDYQGRIAGLLNCIGLVYWELSDYTKALQHYDKALSLGEELDDKKLVCLSLGNIANVYAELFDYTRAIEYYNKALSLAEGEGSEDNVALWVGNIGTVHLILKDSAKALECYSRALNVDEKLGNKVRVADWQGNIGSVLEEQHEYDRALEYYYRALHVHEELGTKRRIGELYEDVGTLYARQEWSGRDESKAEHYLLRSIALSTELGTKQYVPHKTLSELYKSQRRWEESRIQFETFHNLEKEVQSDLARKQGDLLEQKKQLAERERQLSVEREVSAATSNILRKMLPASIADRLIAGEQNIADYMPAVSILFADIVGFTPIAAQMQARDVLSLLNFVFNRFDSVMEKHGCQKIKTMGDGYMAVCGAPLTCDDHAERLAHAALALMSDIELPESLRLSLPKGSVFHLRIGLHCGPVFAGIVGDKGFMYDVYSDAVNLASRMESHGEENRIHCSSDFYCHLQNRFAMTKNTTHGIAFEKRDEMEIKGKGIMRTYFLEKA